MSKSEYYTILTKIGIAKFIAARASGNGVNLKSFKLSSKVILPNEEMQSLEDVVYEANINSKSIDEKNPNYVNLMCHVPSNIGGFEVNAIGIYDEEGDLLAVGNTPRTYKPLLEQGSAKELMIKVVMELSNAEEVILKLDPSVIMASRDYVDAIKIELELKIKALEEELKALINTKEDKGTAANLDKALETKLTNLINKKENTGVAKALVDALRTELLKNIDSKYATKNFVRETVMFNRGVYRQESINHDVMYTNTTRNPLLVKFEFFVKKHYGAEIQDQKRFLRFYVDDVLELEKSYLRLPGVGSTAKLICNYFRIEANQTFKFISTYTDPTYVTTGGWIRKMIWN
ncbi:phage tail-collar fiber protein (DUF3751 domain) [Campylobacter subantarcticus LMG 24377]|uniref:phage tail protein n=1 Tax=Campylobacter subantarcticus TaxID=497724 RepID=UPI00058227E1|nr:phage tail protein [Campylobacter subantarcticus]AJC92500.1 phage tail-collar fiber protein (DUF3751 domain) [Campylobacter subantarcticus LMG 24377]